MKDDCIYADRARIKCNLCQPRFTTTEPVPKYTFCIFVHLGRPLRTEPLSGILTIPELSRLEKIMDHPITHSDLAAEYARNDNESDEANWMAMHKDEFVHNGVFDLRILNDIQFRS